MRSIKVYLVIAVLSVMTLTIFLASLHGYRTSMAKAEQLFDSQLDDVAHLLLNVYADTGVTTANVVAEDGPLADIVYQLWQGDSGPLLDSNTSLSDPLGEFSPGFGFRNHLGYRWRICSRHDSSTGLWVMVAERADIRYLLAENLVIESIVPVVVGLPVAALIIWWLIGTGLALLKRLALDLENKQVEDLSPLHYEHTPRELVVVVDSLNTLFHRLEQAFRRERNFAADAAHELRTPISALKVHVHNLRRDVPSEVKLLDALDNDLSRLSHLVEQILLLYRTNPDNCDVSMEPVDLTALTQEIVSEMYQDFDRREQTIELLTDEHHRVEGDSNFLTILIRNLLSNANKYAPVGGKVEIEIVASQGRVSLTVLDSGPGFDQAEFERVFDRFYRVGGDRHASGAPGCGLGLSIVKHIADLHRAQVRFFCRKEDARENPAKADMFAVCIEFPVQTQESMINNKCGERT